MEIRQPVDNPFTALQSALKMRLIHHKQIKAAVFVGQTIYWIISNQSCIISSQTTVITMDWQNLQAMREEHYVVFGQGLKHIRATSTLSPSPCLMRHVEKESILVALLQASFFDKISKMWSTNLLVELSFDKNSLNFEKKSLLFFRKLKDFCWKNCWILGKVYYSVCKGIFRR